MSSSKLTALTEISVPALDDLAYLVDDPSGTPVSNKITLARLLGLLTSICDGRLTLQSGTPVTSSNLTAQTTVYFTPYNGNCVSLYDGTRWRLYQFAELSLALGTLTNDTVYDVFLYDTGGSATLKLGPAWSNSTAGGSRGTGAGTTELERFEGVLVNKFSITSGPAARCGRYLGTLRTTSTTTTEDSTDKRFLWNNYNRVRRHLWRTDATGHTYASTAVREWNGGTAMRCHFVLGDTTTINIDFAQLGYSSQLVTATVDVVGDTNPHIFGNAVSPQTKFGIGVPSQTLAAGYRFVTISESAPVGGTHTFSEAYLHVEYMG